MPMNIIALMISYGGANATITHGAGINNKNLNDIVIKVLLSRAKSITFAEFFYNVKY